MSYIELHARSAFSFLRGASLPEQLAKAASNLGMPAMALCDRDGVYGAPRFFRAARELGMRPIIGAELTMEDGTVLPVLVESRVGYQNLCRLVTESKLRAEKNKGAVQWAELPGAVRGLVALTGDEEGPVIRALQRNEIEKAAGILEQLVSIFGPGHLFVELQRHHVRGEERIIAQLCRLAAQAGLPLLATNGVLYSEPNRHQVLDVFTCIRHHTHLDAAGRVLAQNSERHLKPASVMWKLFHDLPEAIDATVRLAERLEFSLDDLGYQFPTYPVPHGETMDSVLRQQTFAGARQRYGTLNQDVSRQLEHELALIGKLGFAGYFLIVGDIVKFCRENDILAQGRGSAANSAVCYSLGITAVDPVGSRLLFERFLSEGRKGWPDIDIDLPSGERRERVIQEVYQRYGKHGAAMTANVITYRGRSAAREIGKALNLSNDVLGRFSNLFSSGDFPHTLDLQAQLAQAGLPPEHPRSPAFVSVYQMMHGLPRHLGQHSGGMIICQGTLSSIMPLENASMPGRVVAQWDKEDCEDLGIVKVDLLGLGMMSVLQDAIALTHERGHPVDLAKIPQDDEATYTMMQKADTLGVFQIESRAQIATLPRMKPKCFYDVVIEVAIIRPGPIHGHLMHPYLARRAGREPVTYYDERVRPILERTLGVPLFQEQILKIAMVMADFSGAEAEELRRAMSFHRSPERMLKVEGKLRSALQRNGVQADTIEQIVKAIGSFALYGFPESHAISFAILAYGSAYLKRHYAPEFYASLLNNQPMGFYSPATLVKDAKRHGLRIRSVCAVRSDWRCTIESDDSVRLGLCMVQGLHKANALSLLEARGSHPFRDLEDLKRRTSLNKEELRTLAGIGALNSLASHRRDALWEVEREIREDDLFSRAAAMESESPDDGRMREDSGRVESKEPAADRGPTVQSMLPLEPMNAIERLQADYAGTRLTIGPHPMELLRPQVPNAWRAADLVQARHGQIIQIAGNVICRQRPGTAKGFVFVSLEDETGVSNAIVAPKLFETLRLVITQEPFLRITGRLQNTDNVIVIQARVIEALNHGTLAGSASYDFH
ncbi:MAG: error-prone DNA polymerase [Verrucomicrobia bacterium]|nr:error-prone DNA polymerase [Verrucomicrobiota bacterium]